MGKTLTQIKDLVMQEVTGSGKNLLKTAASNFLSTGQKANTSVRPNASSNKIKSIEKVESIEKVASIGTSSRKKTNVLSRLADFDSGAHQPKVYNTPARELVNTSTPTPIEMPKEPTFKDRVKEEIKTRYLNTGIKEPEAKEPAEVKPTGFRFFADLFK